VCRPLVYASLAIGYHVYYGLDERPVPKRAQTNPLAALGFVLFLAAALLAGMIAGFGRNPMSPNFTVALANIWRYCPAVFLSELLRIRLIKDAPEGGRRVFTAAMLTLVYAFVQTEISQSLLRFDIAGVSEMFFTAIFPVLALNAVLTYMAFESSLAAVLIIRAAYTLTPVLSPVMPKVSKVVWSVLTSSVLFVMVIIYHLNIRKTNRMKIRKLKKRARYAKRNLPVLSYAVSASAAVLFVAFILRSFAYFPVIVLTGSMTGAVDRGAVVVVEKLGLEETLNTVKEGDIIHYEYDGVEMMHRVIEFRYDDEGGRVYITKGDANPIADSSPVEPDQVLGIPRSFIPYIGYPIIIIRMLLGG